MLSTLQFRWLLEHLTPPQNVGPSSLMIMGDGPLDAIEWQHALVALNREVYFPDQYLATLLVGRENWSKKIVLDLLEARQGLKVRIVSQEMLLAWFATRQDPFAHPERLRELWGDHPVYRFLDGLADEAGFDWPSLLVPEGSDAHTERPLGGWDAGILSANGYRVGAEATYAPTRREALAADRRAHYGAAGSCRRLEAIAHAIARQFKLALPRPEMALARTHWEQDFYWLKNQYDTRCRGGRFDWPTLDVE
jgi:hypothetical protein